LVVPALALGVALVAGATGAGDGALDLCDSASGAGDDVAGVTESNLRDANECVLAGRRCFARTRTLRAEVDAMTRMG
jgi:hypothetical protein